MCVQQAKTIQINSINKTMHKLAVQMAVGSLLFILAGCDLLGLDTPNKIEARITEDAKAIGGACRNAMRAIEDCYTLNPKAKKSAVAAGWREMDEYMRENKLEGLEPKLTRKKADSVSERPEVPDEPAEEAESAPHVKAYIVMNPLG